MALFSTIEKLEMLLAAGVFSDKDRVIFEQYLNDSVNGLGVTDEIEEAVNSRYAMWLDHA